jgi:hypothetical protein
MLHRVSHDLCKPVVYNTNIDTDNDKKKKKKKKKNEE